MAGTKTEEELIAEVRVLCRPETETPPQAMARVEEGLRLFPRSARLHCLKGDLILCLPESPTYRLDDALACYRKASELDPRLADAHESLGYFYDVVKDEIELAEEHFRRAIGLRGGPQSYVGLARALAQQGREREALEALERSRCPHHADVRVTSMREEIEAGVWSPLGDDESGERTVEPAEDSGHA